MNNKVDLLFQGESASNTARLFFRTFLFDKRSITLIISKTTVQGACP